MAAGAAGHGVRGGTPGSRPRSLPHPGALPGGVLCPPAGWGQGPAQAHATRAVLWQVLYRKSMQALDLLLRTFISENKSMDEVCFLLQVRAGSGASGAAGRRAFPRVHSGWVPGAQAPPHPDPSSLGAVATVRAEAGASAAWRGLRGAPFLLVALWTGTVSGTVRRFPHGPETLSWPSEAKPALGQTPLVCGMAPDSASPDGAGLRGEQGGESVW